jgi:hypothetical protein
MKKTLTVLMLCTTFAVAQGPDVRAGGGPGRAAGFGGPGGFGGRGGMAMGAGHIVTGAPFSAVEVLTIQEKFADGNSVNTTTSTPRARDSQGRTYMSETVTPPASSGKPAYTRITINDPVAGYRYELNSSTMIAVQSRIPNMRPAPPSSTTASGNRTARTAPAATPGTETRRNGAVVTTSSLGTVSMNGVAATHTLITEVIPAGAIGNAQAITTTRTTYVSPDLKMPVQIKTSDPRFGSSDMELTNISTGEPSASLFTVPGGYTIQKASRGGPGGERGPGGPGAFRRGGPPATAQ